MEKKIRIESTFEIEVETGQQAQEAQQEQRAPSPHVLPQLNEDSNALLSYSVHLREVVPLIKLVHDTRSQKHMGFTSPDMPSLFEARNQTHKVHLQD